MSTYLRKNWLFWVANIGAAVPLLWLAWDFWQGNLSVNPIADITTRTGKAALILLLLSLACTPLITLTGWRQPGTVRKSLGLWTFVYASFHLLNFVGLDYGFDLGFILQDGLPTKPYIVVGLLAFLILLPMAITSTKGWQRRLGKNWKQLHKLVYVAGVAVIVHFFWIAKAADDWEPALYGIILSALLILRVPTLRKRIVAWRQSVTTPTTSHRSPARSAKPLATTTDDLRSPAD